MQFVGSAKVETRVGYLKSRRLIEPSDLVLTDGVESIKREFGFSSYEQSTERGGLVFRNGRASYQEKSVYVDKLEIGNVGLAVTVRTGDYGALERLDEAAREILLSIEKRIDSVRAGPKLADIKRIWRIETTLKAKLDIDPLSTYTDKVVKFLSRYAKEMAMTEYSTVEVHMPVLMAQFVSEPDIRPMLSKAALDNIPDEIRASSGSKSLTVFCDTPAEYRERVFRIVVDAGVKTLLEIVHWLEENF